MGALELRDGSGRPVADLVNIGGLWRVKPSVPDPRLRGNLDLYEDGTKVPMNRGENERGGYVSVNLRSGTQRFRFDKQESLVDVLDSSGRPRLKATLGGVGSAGTQEVEEGPNQLRFID